MGGMSLLEMLEREAAKSSITVIKQKFGEVMHDPNSTEDEIAAALQAVKEADGYENLPDE